MNIKEIIKTILKEGSPTDLPSIKNKGSVSSKDKASFLYDKAKDQLRGLGIYIGDDYMDDIYTLSSFVKSGKKLFEFKFTIGETKFSGKARYDKEKSNNLNTLVFYFEGKTDGGGDYVFKRFIVFNKDGLKAPFVGAESDFPGLSDKEVSLEGLKEGDKYKVKLIKPSQSGGFMTKPNNTKTRNLKIVNIGIENSFSKKTGIDANESTTLSQEPIRVRRVTVDGNGSTIQNIIKAQPDNWKVKLGHGGNTIILIDPSMSEFLHGKPRLGKHEIKDVSNWLSPGVDVDVEKKSDPNGWDKGTYKIILEF